MAKLLPAEVEKRHVDRIASFILRARRIASHSIAQDIDKLEASLRPQVTVQFSSVTGKPVASQQVQHFPNEEIIESAAARVRPLLLSGDGIDPIEVMNSIGYFCHKAGRFEEFEQVLKDLKRDWRSSLSETGEYSYAINVLKSPDSSVMLTNKQLAFAWIYGDTVHADADRRAGSREFGIDERFLAACHLVCNLVWMTVNTLPFIRFLIKERILPAFEAELAEVVTMADVEEKEIANVTVWVAPSGQGFAEGKLISGPWKKLELHADMLPTSAPEH